MKCNSTTWFCLMAALTFSVTAAESTSWDSANNIVTYSDTIRMALGGMTQTGYLSQFNANELASRYGGTADEYSLVKVVLSIDGALSGTVAISNPNSPGQDVQVNLYDFNNPSDNNKGWNRIQIGSHSAHENFSHKETVTLDPSGSYTLDAANPGSGPASSDVLNPEDFSAFIGSSTVAAQIDFQGQWSLQGLGNGTTVVDVFGDAVYSVSYYYDYTSVPEPSSLIFLIISSLVLATRRKVTSHNFGRG